MTNKTKQDAIDALTDVIPAIDKDKITTVFNSFIAALESEDGQKEAINNFKQEIEALGTLRPLIDASDCTASAESACSEYSDPLSFGVCFAASYAGCMTG